MKPRYGIGPRCLLVGLGLIMALSGVAPSVAAEMTLSEAVRYGLEHSPWLEAASSEISVRGLERKSSVASFFPTLDLKSTHGFFKSREFGAPFPATSPWQSDTGLILSETLYDGGESLVRLSTAKIAEKRAEVSYDKARESMKFRIISEFYALSLATHLFELQTRQKEVIEKLVERAGSQYRQGLKTSYDYTRFQGQLERAELVLLQTRANLNASAVKLHQMLGTPRTLQADTRFVPEPVRASKELGHAQEAFPAAEATLDYRLADLEVSELREQTRLSRLRFWPQLTLDGYVSTSNIGYLSSQRPFIETQTFQWAAALGLTFNLWDWGTRTRAISIANLNQEASLARQRQVLQDTDGELQILKTNISQMRAILERNETLVTLETGSYSQIEREYRAGRASYLDLVSSLDSLNQSKSQLYSSYFSLLTEEARLRYYSSGLPVEERVAD